jgi:hypothetical protein
MLGDQGVVDVGNRVAAADAAPQVGILVVVALEALSAGRAGGERGRMTAAEMLCEIVLGALSAAWLIAGARQDREGQGLGSASRFVHSFPVLRPGTFRTDE